jgi:hypothetical protein
MKLSMEEKKDLVRLSGRVKSNTNGNQVIKLGNRYFYIRDLG